MQLLVVVDLNRFDDNKKIAAVLADVTIAIGDKLPSINQLAREKDMFLSELRDTVSGKIVARLATSQDPFEADSWADDVPDAHVTRAKMRAGDPDSFTFIDDSEDTVREH